MYFFFFVVFRDSDLEKGLEDSDLEKGLECLVNLINLRHSSDEKPEESAIVTCTSQRIRHLRVKNALDEAKTRRLKQNIQRLSDKIALVFVVQNKIQLCTNNL